MSKGSKNNRIKDWVKYREEHDSIFKKKDEFIICYCCGAKINKNNLEKHPEFYILECQDKVCHINCDYN